MQQQFARRSLYLKNSFSIQKIEFLMSLFSAATRCKSAGVKIEKIISVSCQWLAVISIRALKHSVEKPSAVLGVSSIYCGSNVMTVI